MTARLSIRSSTYRGEVGWSLLGRDTLNRAVVIFTRHRQAAEAMRERIRQGQEVRACDFEPPWSLT